LKGAAKVLELNDKQKADFYYRSYTSMDGLWFMKVEDRYGFDAAVDIDVEVWKVLPKLQARILKPLVSGDTPMERFYECYTTRLALDGFQFDTEKTDNGFRVMVKRCPWYEFMVRSNRGELCAKVLTAICHTVQPGWAREFGENIEFDLPSQMCQGAGSCMFQFSANR
jgi:hypothetical protein